jgi:hypothetical protein
VEHSARIHVLVSMEPVDRGRSRCDCGYSGTHGELQIHLAESRPPRRMPDGSPCWCVGDMEPHDGWIHAPWCSSIRRLARRLE